MKADQEIKAAIRDIISALMDETMEEALINDPFNVDKHRAMNPIYAALVPDEISKHSHFERKFGVQIGKFWQQVGLVAARAGLGYGVMGHIVEGVVKKERLRRNS